MAKRKHERMAITFEVELNSKSIGKLILKTLDISDGGLFLINDGQSPSPGTVVQVKLKDDMADGSKPPILNMEIVRTTDQGMGLKFIK